MKGHRDAANLIVHHYQAPAVINEAIPLYSGRFTMPLLDRDLDFTGEVVWRWHPSPGVHARGEREPTLQDLQELLGSGRDDSVWQTLSTIALPLGAVLPTQPPASLIGSGGAADTNYAEMRVGPQDVGEGDELDRVTFLIANGWPANDGVVLHLMGEPSRIWRGRLVVTRAGWQVTIDSRPEFADPELGSRQRVSGGFVVTHIAEVRRSDDASFSSSDVAVLLDSLRLAFSLACGRTSACILPVGWLGADAVWARWRAEPVDAYRAVSTFLDVSIAAEQVSRLMRCCIDFCVDPIRMDVLRYATAFYVSANYDLNVELATAVAVSGLAMLAYDRFVNTLGQLSKTAFERLSTEEQIRLLLDDYGIDTTIPMQFRSLEAASSAIHLLDQSQPRRDALGTLIFLRNKIIHPTNRLPNTWDVYSWAEASMTARHFLLLAILRLVGYDGYHRSDLARARGHDPVAPVPWATEVLP